MDLKQTIARRIQMARAERNIRQVDLGELIGVNSPYVTKLESGKLDLRVETLERIALALQKPISYFFEPVEEVNLRRVAAETKTEYKIPNSKGKSRRSKTVKP